MKEVICYALILATIHPDIFKVKIQNLIQSRNTVLSSQQTITWPASKIETLVGKLSNGQRHDCNKKQQLQIEKHLFFTLVLINNLPFDGKIRRYSLEGTNKDVTRERSKQRFEWKPCAWAALKTETITDQSANGCLFLLLPLVLPPLVLLLLLPPTPTPTIPPPMLFNVYNEKSAQLAD
ncbi:hypothetical protein T10_3001 [Trichinella papuae]|uniref:Uncharacterized protein n=1 Tax=Trichinella papuae TaxID=268474 RepID=A0A0V1M6N1_9BILA|nr:hypothetical protein T10_3001 [Trichinella papuae]